MLPRIGVLEPLPARAAIREVFLRHVIGGKRLSKGPAFARMVRAATPDVVLAGVEVMADGAPGVPGVGDVIVVDVGGATTDVYSVVTPDGEDAALHREVVATLWRARTVEGDLGTRWSAPGVVAAARAERLLQPPAADELQAYAERAAADPAMLPADVRQQQLDATLTELAVTIAVRRLAPVIDMAAQPQKGGQGDDDDGDPATQLEDLPAAWGVHHLLDEAHRQDQYDHRDDPALEVVEVTHFEPGRHSPGLIDLDLPDEQLVEADGRYQQRGSDEKQVDVQQEQANLVAYGKRMVNDAAE